jgi:phosphoglycerate transport regulatory protein PgtC
MVKFDVTKSEVRNDVVDVLFDQLITFQLDPLKAATKAIHEAEAALAKKDNPQSRALVVQARDLIAAMPVDEAAASAKETTGAFSGAKQQKGARQAELEQQWAAFAKQNYAQAQSKAEEALKLTK